MRSAYRLDLRRMGWRWWATLSTDRGHIVGSASTWTKGGARRWARRRARLGLRYSPPVDAREEVAA